MDANTEPTDSPETSANTLNVGVLLFHQVHELDAIGPYSAMASARQFLGDSQALNVYTLAKSRNSVESSGGIVITPTWAFASAPAPDVLLVPGGAGVYAAQRDKALMNYLRDAMPQLQLLSSVCTGALILGELGWLRDKRATTWAGKQSLLLDYQVAEIVDARVVKNLPQGQQAPIWCAGGVSAGIDMGLSIIEAFFGADVANKAAVQINYPFWTAETSDVS